MRSDSICAKISAKLDEIFCETTGWLTFGLTLLYLDLEEQIRAGHEICGYLENAASEREMQDLTFIIHDKIQYYLMSTRPENLLESDTQQLRHMCLEIIQKIPNGDHLRPFSRSLLEMLFKLVEIENEDNVLVCVKLIIDIHKFYRPSFSNDVSRFLDFVKDVYRDLKFRAYKIFEPKLKLEVPAISDIDLEAEVLNTFTVTSVYTQEPKSDGSFMVYHILPKSGFSLKVMQEIPILVVLMYQLFKQHIHQDISDFIPLIMDFINLKPTEEQKRNSNFSQEVFIDFMAAQVKTLSFLAYVIKIYQDSVELHSVSLVQGMMNLLINCPPSVTNMRKEFFIAARHILSAQEIRPKFLQVLDELMNEEILIGQGYTIRDALRPLAYSTLADLTHHIRSSLSLSKIARAIDVYGRNMHDHTLPFSIQQMSLRLILNLVECIRQRAVSATSANQGVSAANTEDRNNEVFSGTARRLLLQTLRLCVLKAKVVADHYIPALESTCISEPSEEVTSGSTKQRLRSIHAYLFANISSFSSELNEVGSFTDKNVPASDFTNILNSGTDLSKVHGPRIVEPLAKLQLSYTDVRTLVKALITGIRTVVTSMIQCPHDNTSQTNGATSLSATPSKQSISNRILSPDELIVLTEYFSFGMRMIDIVQFVNRDNRLYLRSQPSTKSPDERLLIETFALTFAQLNPISFHEIFSYKIHDYVVWCSRSPSYTNIALHLLSQPNKTSYFGYILLSYLVDRLERLGDGTNESALYMRLLKLCFSSVNMSGTENELVMKLHLRRIVQGSMHYCLTAKEPTAYLTLLRTLFRSIGGGAHDKLYREFFPLLPEMLTTLNRLLRSPHRSNARDLLGELCVIVPVRLSTLLPYLSLLMEPLVYVLNCNTVNQGLRTLELCVDNMQPDFLHDHLYQVRGDMLLALYNSLHSPSEYVQKMAFKVLGKLGLFNRTNLLETQRLRISSTEGEAGPQLRFHLNEFRNQPIDISVRCLVDAAVEVLQDSSSDGPSKLRSWEFLQSVCVAALNLNHSHQLSIGVEDFYNCFIGDTKLNNMILKYIEDICVTVYSENLGVQLNRSSCCMADDLCNHVMIMTVAGLLLAGLSKELYDAHGDFIAFLVRYATFLSIMQQFNSHLSAAFESRRLCKVDTMTTFSSDIIGSLKTPSDDHLRELDLFSISQDLDTVTPTVNEPQTSTLESHLNSSSLCLNPNLIIDSIMFVMGHEAKQLTQHMCILLEVIHNTAFTVLSAVTTASRENNGDKFTTENIKKAVANLQIFQHIGHVIVDMLYHSAWYVKWGACAAILCLARFIHPSWFCSNLINLLRGLLYCIHSLSNQMNQGALMMARDCARIIITTVIISLKDSNDTNHSTNTTIIEDEDGKSMKSTPMLTRKRSSTTSQRRTVQVRRGRSANNPTVESSTNETSIKVGDEPLEVDNHDNEKCSTSSNFSPSLSPLLDAVIGELLDSLLSETDSVRTEARCLLRLIGLILGQPLCKLLASQWYQRIGHVLPPKQPCRLSDLPISTQLAVLEANYFFGQPEKSKVISKVLDSSKPFDFDIDDNDSGVGLLRYDLSKRDDCIFLSDVRSLLTQFEMTSDPTATTNNNSTASNTTAVSSNANNNSTVNSDQDKTQLNGTYSHSKFTWSNSKTVIPLSSNCMRLINLRVVACQVLSVTWYLDTQKARNLTALFKGMSCKNEYIHEAAFSCLREFISKTSIDIELRHANIKQIVQNIRQNSIRCIHTSHLNTSLESVINKQNPASISAFTSSNLELCTLLLDLFHLIPLATSKYVSLLLECVVNAERSLNIEPTSCLRLPLTRFLSRYPAETCALLLTGSRWPYDSHANRIFLFALGCSQGQPIVDYLRTNYHILMDLIQPDEISDQKSTDNGSGQLCLPQVGTLLTFACPRHLAIRAVHTIHQILPNWLTASNLSSIDTSKCNSKLKSNHFSVWETKYHPLFSSLVAYWQSNLFVRRQSNLTLITLTKDAIESQILDKYMTDIGGKTESVSSNLSSKINVPTRAKPTISVAMENLPCDPGSLIYSGTADHTQWDEPRLLLDCLLDCFRSHPDDFDLLFVITIGVTRLRYVADLYPLRCLLVQLISESDLTWHRRLFLHFIAIVKSRLNFIHTNNSPEFSPIAFGMNNTITTEDMYKLLAHLILPCLSNALERGENEIFLGGPAKPFEMNDSDLVHLFVSVLLEDPAVQTCTELRVMYYQMASLFVYHTPDYVHMGSDSEQGYRLRKFTDFARPCLTSSLTAVDLQEKYTGLQLLSHLIAKFNVLRTATVQVFQCLAKGAHTETKKIVNPALDILIPAWVQGSEDQKALALATKKIMLEDHGIQSCVHILGIIVRHSDFYYPIRHQILPHIIVIISRLSVQQLPVEQRRLALDMIYTAAQWDVRCRREITENNSKINAGQSNLMDTDYDNLLSAENIDIQSTTTTQPANSPMDKPQRDQLVNLLIRFACQAIDASQSGSLSEQSISRTLAQLEFAVRSDVWGGETCELRLAFIDRYFTPDDSSHSTSSTPSNGVPTASLNSHGIHISGASGTTPASAPSGPHTNTSVASSTLGATQATSLLMTLEVLRVLFSTLESSTLLVNVKYFSAGLCNVLTRQLTNVRLIRSCAGLLRALLERYPAEASHRQKITAYSELFDIYSAALKAIQDSFTMFSENVSKTTLLTRLQSAFLLFTSTQVQSNPHAFVDRCIVQLVKLVSRLIQDLVTSNCNSSNAQESGTSAQLTDLLIMGLEMIKSRLNVVSHEMRKTVFGPDLCLIMDRARDPRLFCAVLQVLRDWINVPKSEEHFAPTAREKVNFFCRLWQAYPRWIDNSPDVAREILECIYDVYASTSVFRNHDLYVKLEQAFCCGLISPFPDITERFIALYLEASQLRYPANSYLRRVDTNIVLLCDVDTTASPMLSVNSQSFDNIFNYFSKLPAPVSEMSTDDSNHQQINAQRVCDSVQLNEFKGFIESQIKGLHELSKLSIGPGLRGMLCLAHKRPALASHIFHQLWRQIWDRLLLQQSETQCSLLDVITGETSEVNSLAQEHSNAFQPVLVHDSLQSGCLESTILSDSSSVNGRNLSPNEVRGFVIPQLVRFLTSDQHVHPSEPQPSSLGAFFNALASCADTLLIHLPLPAIAFLRWLIELELLQLKQLGQWEALDSLASSFQSASLFGPGSMSAGNANSTGVSLGNSGGSSYWGLKADAAWRRSDWSEVYYDLARLANECPHNELPRYALIQAAACVAGRRAAGFTTLTNSNTDIDSYNPGITSGDLSTGSTSGPNSSVSNNASSTNITSTPPHSNTTSMSPMNNIVNMIHASEQESHRVVSVTLMEWRRLPLIVTTQHVPLLQIAHRAVEITEGNSLLAQYCGHVLSGSSLTSGVSNSTYSSPSQTSSGSSTPVPQSNSISASSGTSVNMRLPFNQALHDYKTVFKAWQSRPCSIGDDLGFWHDLFSWRQVVEECIISCHPFLQKLKSENSNLLALCQRELALSQLQLARGARKCRFPSIAQQHLDRYARMNLPPLFEKTKQEIKLKLTDLRRDELLEGLELMEKTNIQQFEKKDRAKFFCYKAVFFSHFNKGDEATKNFGYATQMQDNLHKVWSIYGDFLENVYSNYPSAKREVAVSTTGIFAMQALMEAASVSGGIERKSRADIAKCLWLLTLDDVSGQQRLAHTFEARASRVRPEAFLPWLPDLVASLLRPEGRFIVPALRRVIASYPTILYGYLKGLQHQLATEVNNDQKLAEFIQNPENKNSPFVSAIQNRITSTLGSENDSVIKCGNLSWSLSRGNSVIETNNCNRRSGYNFGSSTHQSFSLSSAPLSNASKIGSHNPNTVYSNTCAANASVSSNSNSLINSKKKKRVIVVMRGVEGERLNASPHSSSPPPPQQQQKNSDSIDQSTRLINNHPKKLKRKHSARLYAVDLFINEVGGRLRPTWAEQFLCQLCSVLDYLQRLAYAHLHPGRLWNLKNLEIQTIPHWLATELEQIGRNCENTTSLHNSVKFDSSPLCGTTSNIFRKDDKEKLRSSQSKFSSKTSDCIKSEGDLDIPSEQDDLKSSNQQQKQSILSTNIPAFYEVNQIASEVLSTECEKDPFFMHLRAILSTEMSNLQNESILSLIQKLTRRWIPMVEQHVAKLPVRTHISNYGARRLLELPNIVSSVNNASLTLSSKTNVSSNAPQVYSVFPSMPTVPCLELPGESVLLQSSVSNLGSMVNSQNDCSQHIGGYINNISLYLHVAEIMPHVERVRCSSGAFAPPARRIGIRASNGRLFFYDLPCTSTPPIMDLAIMQVDALNGAKCHEILNTISTSEPANLEHLTEKEFCPSAYISWREIGPLQFFQMINTILLGQPETAKRNISLFVPRRMEVGPNGLYLTQVGSSVSAANVSIASACPLPSANPVNNRRLTALARPPSIATNCSSTYVDENQSIHSSLVCEEAYKQYSWSLSFAESNLTSRNPNEDQLPIQGFSKSLKSLIRIPSPPPGPLPNLMTVQSTNLVNQSTVIGSAAMALEAVGRPSGLDAGCRCTCTTLFGILEKCNCTLFLNAKSKQKHKSDDVIQSIKSERLQQQEVKIKTKSSCSGIQDSANLNLSVNPPTGCRNLVCLFYEYISQITNQTEITNQDLFKLFLDLSSRIPQAPYVRDPLFSNLGTLGGDDIDQNVALKSLKDQLEFPRGKLLRHWAENQMLDAESYWLLRRSLAHNLGVYGLMERLFHLTPLHPSCLVIDPRSGHTEAHHVCFGLPGDNYLSGQSHSINTERGFNQAYFVSCFNQSMLIQKLDKYGKKQSSSSQLTPKIPADSSTTDSIGDEWLSHNRPVPFRLTPHLAGLVCLPGAPVKVGPFSASFTTAAQALQNAQYDHSLANLYRTFLRRDYILWHRGRQSSFYAYQLLMSEQNETIQQSLVETCPTLPCSSNENDSSTFNCCSSPILVPDLTNEQLINLITCTVDSMNSKLKVASDYSGTEPKSWKLIEEATKPANLVHVNPNLLPWL
ncbi:Transformation/transcription domain-associated protein [Schistosoma japonicum]|nr:Transformation/transcription domain-associated protein [Schistosoma japonicum]